MDEAALRRRLDALTPEPSPTALDAARLRLTNRMTLAEAPPARRLGSARPTRRVIVGGLGAAAAATAAAVLMTSVGPAPSASAEVARTLRGAADAVSTRQIATGGVREHRKYMISSASGLTRHGDEVEIDGGVLVQGEVTLRRTDRAGVWERIWSPVQPIEAFGPDKAELLRQAVEDSSAAPIVVRSDTSRQFWEQPNTVSPQEIASTPRDPEALIRDLTGVTNADSAYQKGTERAIDEASALLGSGLADAGLQAAIYRALEHLPGLTINRHATDVDGRAGVAIGVITSHGLQRIDIIIDPATGRYLGRTEVNLTSSAGAPAGSIEEGSAAYAL